MEREKETTAALISAFASEGYDTSVTKDFDGIEFVLGGKKGKKGGGGGPRPHTIDIDGDQWELKGPDVVPLETDLSKFKAANNDERDKRQYNDFEFVEEAKFFGRENVKGRPITHLRTADDVHRQLVPAGDVIRSNSSSLVACGFDTEGKGATMQVAVKCDEYEKNFLIQLKSETGNHCLSDGVPAELVEFVTMEKIVFVGKSVKADIVELATLLQIPS